MTIEFLIARLQEVENNQKQIAVGVEEEDGFHINTPNVIITDVEGIYYICFIQDKTLDMVKSRLKKVDFDIEK